MTCYKFSRKIRKLFLKLIERSPDEVEMSSFSERSGTDPRPFFGLDGVFFPELLMLQSNKGRKGHMWYLQFD